MTTKLRGAARPPVVLTIAGFDPSSGAGITADLQVFTAHGLFGTACPTGLTVQSTLGVEEVRGVDPPLLLAMLRALKHDLPPAAVKIGMLVNAEIVRAVCSFLEELRGSGPRLLVVLDPVLRSSSGRSLLESDATVLLREELLAHVSCMTPNRSELAVLAGAPLSTHAEIEKAGRDLMQQTGLTQMVVTGGDETSPDDLLLREGLPPEWLVGRHISTTSTHGTGCAFSSALLSGMVLGEDVLRAAKAAKAYVAESLLLAPGLGHGRGPLYLQRDREWLRRVGLPETDS